MGTTAIIVCPRCGGLLLAASNQKTRTCPHCNTRIEVRKAKKIASAQTAFEASQMLRKLKSKKGFNRE
jgi:DNA-directed RNA polymerase subunit M/transcription elongation factor TFIIS